MKDSVRLKDPLNEYQKLAGKIRIMDELLAQGQVEQPRHPLITHISQFIFGLFISSHQVVGLDHLIKAKEWAEAEGKGVILTPRHESHADSPAIRFVLAREGLSDFANNIVFMAGVNMRAYPPIRMLMREEHVIYVATPFDLAKAKFLLDYKDESGLDQGQVYRLERARNETFPAINRIAIERKNVAQKNGKTVLLFPEATRSRDGFINRAPREVSLYFPRDGSCVVVPMRLLGPKEFFPPEQLIRFHQTLPPFRQHLTMIIGEPYTSDEVWNWKKGWRDREAIPADWVMANIAITDERDIRVDELVYYRTLIEFFRPHRLKEKIEFPHPL